MRRATVAYVLDWYPERSQTFVRDEMAALRDRGVSVVVVALNSGDGDDTDPYPLVRLNPRPTSRSRAGLALAGACATRPRRVLEMRRILEQVPEDARLVNSLILPWVSSRLRSEGVTHVHAHFGWAAASGAWAIAALLKVPWSVTVHANDIFAKRVHLERKLAAADAVVTISDYNRRFLREELHVARPIELVRCGVDLPDLSEEERVVDILVVARLIEKKGIDLLLDALPSVLAKYGPVRVEVIGDGPLLDTLLERTHALGLGEHVSFRGALPHKDVHWYMRRARVFCLPARIADDGDRDGIPVAVLEAMAHSMPVVVGNVSGMNEAVDETTGWLVQPGDTTELSKALLEALAATNQSSRKGAAARERVSRRYRRDVQARLLMEQFVMQTGKRWAIPSPSLPPRRT